MPSPKKGQPFPPTTAPSPSTAAPTSDGDAPISEPRPSSPAPDPGFLDGGSPASNDDASVPPDSGDFRAADPVPPDADEAASEKDAAVPVTRELTDAFLKKKATLDRIRQVVDARCPKGTQVADREDLTNSAVERALEATSLARSVTSMRPWVSRLTQNLVIDHYKADAKQLKWLDRSVDVQELPPDPADEGDDAAVPPDDPTAPPRPVARYEEGPLHRWLGARVTTAADKRMLEMIRFKARTNKTNLQVAAEFGMSEDAYDARLARFKARWMPEWKKSDERRELMIIVWIVRGVLVAAAAAAIYFLVPWRRAEPIAPAPDLRPAPSASAAPIEPRRDEALPTQPQEQSQPQDGKKLVP